MKFIEYSHRHADAIIANDCVLRKRYKEFTDALESISEEDLIKDYNKRKKAHNEKHTAFKSITPSINGLLEQRISKIPGWKNQVEIFNDSTGVLGDTEWRLDFACDEAFCVEVAFNHGEAIAWNLIKPVLSCELNHVQKAVQGEIGIYVCATDKMKIAGNIDSASGSFEKVLRYLPPMMNQLTIPMMIIGLTPFETFKISEKTEIIRTNPVINDELLDHRVMVTLSEDYSTYKGDVVNVSISDGMGTEITIRKSKNNVRTFPQRMIRFLEVLR